MYKKLFSLLLTFLMVVSILPVSADAASYPLIFIDRRESNLSIPVGETAVISFTIFPEYKNERYHVEIYNSYGQMVCSAEDEIYNSSILSRTVNIIIDTAEMGMSEGKYEVKYYMEFYTFFEWRTAPKSYTEELLVVSNVCKGNHNFSTIDIWMEPTCEKTGVATYECNRCGYFENREIPVTGHSWENGVCAVCGADDPNWEETIPPTESTETEPDESSPQKKCEHRVTTRRGKKEATCYSAGNTGDLICLKCDEILAYGEEIAITDHLIVEDAAKEPTCKENGLTAGKHCDYCGKVFEVQQDIPAKGHVEVVDEAVEATCTSSGLTEGKHCSVCNTIIIRQRKIPIRPHTMEVGKCTVCGKADPDWVEPAEPMEPEETEKVVRLAGAHRYETAFLAADQMKANLGIDKFDAVVVASGTNFADALSGSYLATVKNAPILLSFTTDAINNGVKDYIRENLNKGGTVYILGGESAVPTSMETGLDGFTVKRLAGGSRFETNLAILAEAGVGDKPVLVCTGLSFADSLSASAAKLPILLVWNDLTEDQKALLDGLNGNDLYVIGGESAVSKQLEEQIAAYGITERVQGGNRFETSVAIAETFFDTPKSAVLAYAWNFPDGLCGGSLAATMDAPLILTMDNYEAKAAEYIQTRNVQSGIILGGEGLISEATVNNIFQ